MAALLHLSSDLGGFPARNMGVPLYIAGWFQGKSQSKMDLKTSATPIGHPQMISDHLLDLETWSFLLVRGNNMPT